MGIYIPNINANQFDKLCEEKGLKFIYIFIPTPHGRLIDADDLMLAILDAKNNQPELADIYDEDYYAMLDWVRIAPTVIEAEGK